MVRLGGDYLFKTGGYPVQFQFQYGAIGRLFPVQNPFIQEVSIPVWCDWEGARISSPSHLRPFQFQYGAIGSVSCTVAGSALSRFNSSMVRLGDNYPAFEVAGIAFQFQYGAIGREIWLTVTELASGFNSSMVRLGVSENSAGAWTCYRVSIPVWCDWEASSASDIFFSFFLFQFQYGAIGSSNQ